MTQDVPGPLTVITQAIIALMQPAPDAGPSKAEARRAEKRARREAEAQQKKWRDLVERQKVRGEAGNATYEEAAEALRGAGGRPNPLDQRKF